MAKTRALLWLTLGTTRHASPAVARAFLGDDLPAIEAHYGAALNRFQFAPGLEASVHESTGYRVLVLYRDGHSSRETFAKLAAPFDFTAPEITTFLRAHAAGLRWDSLGSANGAFALDASLRARYLPGRRREDHALLRAYSATIRLAGTATAQTAVTTPSSRRFRCHRPILVFANPLTLGTTRPRANSNSAPCNSVR